MRKDKDPYKVLIIEDNLGDFILVSDFLEETILAPEIDHAPDFKQAVDILNQSAAGSYNAIFLDLSLPDKSGEDLIIEILKMVRQTPVIVLTGYTDASFAIKSLSLGASDYLLKDELSATTLYKSLIYNIERFKTLLRLKESELRYSDLFHLSPQAMFVVDRVSNQFLDINEAAISHYGYSKEEFLEMTLNDIMQEDDFKKYECRPAEKNPDQSSFQNLFRFRLKSGTWVDVELRCNLLLFNGIKAEVILANDVTERLTHLNIIQEQNRRLKEIAFEQSHVVRAPLSRMMGLINLIKTTQISQKEELIQLLGYIEGSAYEIDDIIREIVRKTETLKQEGDL
ncbi:response regulator [Lunatimonas salinarum]|uniref:response regulator n=1 Tax=Lunatimonas salinarum TaxID=1774590 RepID=UPI001ADFC8B4|nr:response regulator [Lunatimonas salinarum]